MISDIDHSIAQAIAVRGNEIYGTDYRVDWAYIDPRRNYVYNGSEYVARIRNDKVYFDRNAGREDDHKVIANLTNFMGDGGQ